LRLSRRMRYGTRLSSSYREQSAREARHRRHFPPRRDRLRVLEGHLVEGRHRAVKARVAEAAPRARAGVPPRRRRRAPGLVEILRRPAEYVGMSDPSGVRSYLENRRRAPGKRGGSGRGHEIPGKAHLRHLSGLGTRKGSERGGRAPPRARRACWQGGDGDSSGATAGEIPVSQVLIAHRQPGRRCGVSLHHRGGSPRIGER